MWLSERQISTESLTLCIIISPVRIIELVVELWSVLHYNTPLQYIYRVRPPVVSENAMTQSCGMRAVQTGGLDWDLEQFVCSVFTFTGSTLPQPRLSQGQICITAQAAIQAASYSYLWYNIHRVFYIEPLWYHLC